MNRHPTSSALPILLVVTLVCGYACNDEEKSAAAANTLGISNQKTSKRGGTGKSAYTYKKPYKFVSDWFSPAIPSWEKALAPYVGKHNLRYLEIGVLEGRSLFWILENVATHPSSRLTGIDIVVGNVSENLRISGAADLIEMIQGRSQVVLRTLPADSFDIVYIDGSHRGDDVLVDCAFTTLSSRRQPVADGR